MKQDQRIKGTSLHLRLCKGSQGKPKENICECSKDVDVVVPASSRVWKVVWKASCGGEINITLEKDAGSERMPEEEGNSSRLSKEIQCCLNK